MSGSSRARLFCLTTVGVLLVCLLMAPAGAQDTSATQTYQSGQATVTKEIKSGEVVYVSGNDLVVKLDDGQVKHVVVPENTTFNVDGKDLTIHDLQPGMHLTRTITTTSVPQTVRTVRTIRGTVWHVNAPNTVVLTLPDNTNKQYKIPKGQMFEMDGQKYDVFSLKKGMKIAATVVTEAPLISESSARALTGIAPPPPTPPMQGALLIEDPTPAPQPAAPATEVASLPKTASMIPLIGLLGLLCLGTSLALRASHA